MIKHTDDNNFENDVAKNSKMCIVDFFATWCMPCKMLAPTFEAVSDEYEDVDFYKIDIDQNPALVNTFSIESVPTLIFIKNGEVVEQHIGVRSKNELEEIISRLK